MMEQESQFRGKFKSLHFPIVFFSNLRESHGIIFQHAFAFSAQAEDRKTDQQVICRDAHQPLAGAVLFYLVEERDYF